MDITKPYVLCPKCELFDCGPICTYEPCDDSRCDHYYCEHIGENNECCNSYCPCTGFKLGVDRHVISRTESLEICDAIKEGRIIEHGDYSFSIIPKEQNENQEN